MDIPGISFSDVLGKAEIHRHHAAHQPNSIGESEHAEENGLSESERVQSVVESDKSHNSERNNELS